MYTSEQVRVIEALKGEAGRGMVTADLAEVLGKSFREAESVLFGMMRDGVLDLVRPAWARVYWVRAWVLKVNDPADAG